MSEQKWTPESWRIQKVVDIPHSYEPTWQIIGGENWGITNIHPTLRAGGIAEGEANAQRIVTCVNACQGAPETIQPEAVRAMADALRAARQVLVAQYQTRQANGGVGEQAYKKVCEALRLYHGDES